jgi:D-alanyl-D-alanine carboxypeptidase
MDYRAASKAKEMIADAKAEGIDLLVCSAYRSHDKQTTNFNNKLQSYLDKGWDYDEAYAKTATIIAVPGTSEHESGLALDIVTPSYQVLDAGYKNTKAAKWLLENAADYGFILRFPEDKQDITKIIFEPWHYRYVGEEYSHLIMDSGLCLEEWLGQVD